MELPYYKCEIWYESYMVKYFDSISLYSWNMTDEIVSKIEENIKNLQWTNLLAFQLILGGLLSITSFVMLKNVDPNMAELSSFWITFISNLLIGLIFLFGGYYFIKLFFKTEITIIQYYKFSMYLYLPILMLYVCISTLGMILSFISPTYILFVPILYIALVYYALKQLNTYLYLFKKEFNTGVWSLFGVMILWAIITDVITGLLL